MIKKYQKSSKRLIIALSIMGVVFSIALLGQFFVSTTNDGTNATTINNAERYGDNTYIAGLNISGMTQKEANRYIASTMSAKTKNISLKLHYKNQVWAFNEDDFTMNDDFEKLLSSSSYSPYGMTQLLSNSSNDFNLAFTKVFPNIDEKIDRIIEQIEIPPQNAKVIFLPDNKNIFEIVSAKSGLMVDKQKLYEQIDKQFKEDSNISVEIPTFSATPEITSDYFKDKLDKQGSFSTDLSTSTEGRFANVTTALRKFNGLVIKSGETISFNSIAGPMTAENGYKKAIVIIKGKYTEGIGGGICQASTTLYNAVLRAGLSVSEVHKHTLPVKYVDLALDAMVTEDYADLVFTNTSEYPVYVRAYTTKTDAIVQIYGKTLEDGMVIKPISKTLEVLPAPEDTIVEDTDNEYSNEVQYKGDYFRLINGREGYEAKAYLEYYQNNKLVKTEEIRHEVYKPQPGILIEGTKIKPEDLVEDENVVEQDDNIDENEEILDNQENNEIQTLAIDALVQTVTDAPKQTPIIKQLSSELSIEEKPIKPVDIEKQEPQKNEDVVEHKTQIKQEESEVLSQNENTMEKIEKEEPISDVFNGESVQTEAPRQRPIIKRLNSDIEDYNNIGELLNKNLEIEDKIIFEQAEQNNETPKEQEESKQQSDAATEEPTFVNAVMTYQQNVLKSRSQEIIERV